MYQLGNKSKAELVGVAPEIVKVVETAIAISDVDFSVHDGIRTQEEQAKLLARGSSTTMNSKHLKQADGYGHAVDLVPFVDGQLRWEWEPIYKIAHAVAQAAKKHNVKIIWGAVWDRTLDQLDTTSPESLKRECEEYAKRRKSQGKRVFLDGPHFQKAN